MFLFKRRSSFPCENAQIELLKASESSQEPPKENLLKRFFAIPLVIHKKLRNTYLLIRHAEFRKPASKNVCPMRWLNTFSTFFFTMKITTHPSIMKAILKHPRKDPQQGFFNDQENAKVFLSLVKDMYPLEQVSEEDCLLTCSKDNERKMTDLQINPHFS